MYLQVKNDSSLQMLRPHTQGITFSGRAWSTPIRTTSRCSSASSVRSSLISSVISAPDPSLSLLDIEQILFRRVNEIEEDLKKAFMTFDEERNFTATKGELRRVLQNFVLPLTQSQFDALLTQTPVNPNGTIPYLEFLAKFKRTGTSSTKGKDVKRRLSCVQTGEVLTLNEIESKLRSMISKNIKNVVRSFRLFDYNGNGQIQKHELRRVLENCCFKMKNVEFEKLWNRYSLGRKSTLDYRDLLKNLGINAELNNRSLTENVERALNWEATLLEQQKQKIWRPPSSSHGFVTEDSRIEQIEEAFRKKVSTSQPCLIKAFLSFDVARTGCVSLDVFKSVINNFIFQLPDDVFPKLLHRFGFKETNNVNWENFLKKFQQPLRIENGQTIPIKPSHRVYSAKCAPTWLSSDHILQKLQRHVQDSYPSLKNAFLVLDEGRTGRISRRELRRILDCMMFRVTDEQFKELMIVLDPEHTGFISYHQFLDLFEERESVTGHKWLNNTRHLAKQAPVVLTWDKMENILSEKITSNWKDFYKVVQSLDPKRSGIINQDDFKKLLQSYCPALSEDHFKIIFHLYSDASSSGIAYMEFLQNLGVSLSYAGDVNGVSTTILEESQLREELRQTDLSDRMQEIGNQASNLLKKFTVKEVIAKLKDCVTKHTFTTKDSFLACNKKKNGSISRKDFKKVLEDHELHLDEDQFNELTEILGFTNEGLNYLDFVSLFEVQPGTGPGDVLQNSPNHRVNKAKSYYMTAEECLNQFMDKLRENYEDTYSAFYKIDSNRDGLVTMSDFRRLLESFMFIIKQSEFERLLSLLGLSINSTLNYMDFLHLLQKQEKAECPPWLNSFYKPTLNAECADLACEQAHYYLVTKVQCRWHDLAKTFCEIDSDGNGIIQKKDLRKVLFRFSLPITPKEFEKLWSRYDPEEKGFLTHQEFQQKLGVNFASVDSGPSRRIVEDNHTSLEKHYSNQEKIREEMHVFHKHQTKTLDIKDLEQQIKDKFRDYFSDFSSAFAKIDKDKDGFITVEDFWSTLRDLNFYLDEDQFHNLLYRLRIKVHNSKLSYFDFLRIIDDGRESKYGQRLAQTAPTENCQTLSPQKALVRLQEKVRSSYNELWKAFSTYDKDDTGTIKTFELHQVLDSFCFKLTDKQFKYMLSKLAVNDDQTIDWKIFLYNFSAFTAEPSATWIERVQHATRPKPMQELSMNDIVTRIHEVITARFYTIMQDFLNIDYANINVISKEDFRDLFSKNFMLLTDDQFENLWNTLPLNPYGNLNYHEFLKKFRGEIPLTPTQNGVASNAEKIGKPSSAVIPCQSSSGSPSRIRRPKTAPCVLNKCNIVSQRPSTAAARSSPLINCEELENKLRNYLQKIWQEVHKACRDHDPERSGEVSAADFLAVMKTFNVDIKENDLDQLIVKYDLRSSGKISYPDFFRNVIFSSKPQESNLLQRIKLHKPRIPASTGAQNPLFLDAMLRIQPKILNCWRPLRRTFQSCDEARTGYISITDFKQVLRKYGFNLSEDEFFHILGYFDKDLKLKLSYNDFLSDFLR
ncbi:EF-hand calcium-binding domain-containing protein 6 [Bombina bombina]|uniref:EF-hand calcium-binding domain-containing protein 6 n=1 Tax=Bombina bombina TaxID=8345 RepID=UPI00235A65B1|nr:EF-hand calcium-binding domain-containing protein 6 [Bombina bombina]